MSIKPKSMTVVFDDEKEIDSILTLLGSYKAAIRRSKGTSLIIKPPVIKMFGVDYRVMSIASGDETIGYGKVSMRDPVFAGRITKSLLTVTLERIEL